MLMNIICFKPKQSLLPYLVFIMVVRSYQVDNLPTLYYLSILYPCTVHFSHKNYVMSKQWNGLDSLCLKYLDTALRCAMLSSSSFYIQCRWGFCSSSHPTLSVNVTSIGEAKMCRFLICLLIWACVKVHLHEIAHGHKEEKLEVKCFTSKWQISYWYPHYRWSL
jgi:hypothetical protein